MDQPCSARKLLATLIAVYGLFMTPLGWGWALFVWGYALAWFLVNDRVKLLAYRSLESPVTAASELAQIWRLSRWPSPSRSLKPNPEHPPTCAETRIASP